MIIIILTLERRTTYKIFTVTVIVYLYLKFASLTPSVFLLNYSLGNFDFVLTLFDFCEKNHLLLLSTREILISN